MPKNKPDTSENVQTDDVTQQTYSRVYTVKSSNSSKITHQRKLVCIMDVDMDTLAREAMVSFTITQQGLDRKEMREMVEAGQPEKMDEIVTVKMSDLVASRESKRVAGMAKQKRVARELHAETVPELEDAELEKQLQALMAEQKKRAQKVS